MGVGLFPACTARYGRGAERGHGLLPRARLHGCHDPQVRTGLLSRQGRRHDDGRPVGRIQGAVSGRYGPYHQARDGRLLRPVHRAGDLPDPLDQRAGDRFRRPRAAHERADGQIPQLARERRVQQEPQPLRHLPRQERHRTRELLHPGGGIHGRAAHAPDGHRECGGLLRYVAHDRPDPAHQPFHEEHHGDLRRRCGGHQGFAARHRHDPARGAERARGAAARAGGSRFVRPQALRRGGEGLHCRARGGFHPVQDPSADGRCGRRSAAQGRAGDRHRAVHFGDSRPDHPVGLHPRLRQDDGDGRAGAGGRGGPQAHLGAV